MHPKGTDFILHYVLEVYKQFNGDNNVSGWKVSMIGNDGNVFYEKDYEGGVA